MNCPTHKHHAECLEAMQTAKNAGRPDYLPDIACPLERIKVAIIRLRKGIDVDASWRQFQQDVAANTPDIVKHVDSRWIVSICDTFADFGTPDERRSALLITLMVTYNRFQATIDGAKPFSPMGDGLRTMGTSAKADAHRNLFRRIGNVMRETPSIDPLFRAILNRELSSERNILNRLNRISKRDIVADVRRAIGDSGNGESESESIVLPSSQPAITLITPTGDRHKAFRLCEQWMSRQAFQGPVQWIVVDDGKTPTTVTLQRDGWDIQYVRRTRQAGEPPHTLTAQMQEAIKHVRSPRLAIIEDDDWYAAEYVDAVMRGLDSADMIGFVRGPVCRLTDPTGWKLQGGPQPPLAGTACKGNAIDLLRRLVANHADGPSVDRRLWRAFKGVAAKHVVNSDHPALVQLKSLPGRLGFGEYHQILSDMIACDASTMLEKWIGPRDAALVMGAFDGNVNNDPGGVTVCVTNWNYGRWLGKAIESIQKQTVQPDDWYVIDDGSDDPKSLEIYSGIEPHVHRGEHKGAVAAYNRGLSLCRTPWIIYLDADDELDENYIDKLMDAARLHGRPWAYCKSQLIDDNGSAIGVNHYRPFNAAVLRRKNFIHSSALIKADLIRDAGGWIEHPKEDWHLWRRISAAGHTAAFVPMPLLRYRQHGLSRLRGGRGL